MWPLFMGCGEATSRPASDVGGSPAMAMAGSGAGGNAGSVSSNAAGSGAGGNAGSASANAAGAGGNVAVAGLDCPGAAVDDQPGIVIEAEGKTVEFRNDLLWYDGRPPLLDLSARSDAEDWQTFRIVIFPDSDAVVPGVYGGGFNPVYAWAARPMNVYDSVANRSLAVCVTESGIGEGARVAGRFSVDLAAANGGNVIPVKGTFSGLIGPH
jgi:hypothetical protein